MATFVIDENLPRDLAPALREHGYTVKDVRDHGLRGRPDTEIYEFAQRERAVLVTGDLGFADLIRFPLGTHQGLVVARLPNELSAEQRVQKIVQAIVSLKDTPLEGTLVIVSPSRIRIRKKKTP